MPVRAIAAIEAQHAAVANRVECPNSDMMGVEEDVPINQMLRSGTARSGHTDLKEKVRRRLQMQKSEPYNVQQYYHTSGCWQHVARHPWFENVTLTIIAINAVYMGVDADYNRTGAGIPSEVLLIFTVLSHFFCAYFTLEWIVRFMAFKNKLNTVRDAWFITDSILLALMVTDTWIVPIVTAFSNRPGKAPLAQTAILRLFRLMRLTRMVRMLRAHPELLILVKAMVAASRSVLYVLCLLLLGTYVFAIALRQLSVNFDYGQTYFSTVPSSMYYLLMSGTFMDNLNAWADAILAESGFCLALSLVFVLFANVLALNLLTGLLTQVISRAAETERTERSAQILVETIQECMQMDTDGDGKISFKEFERIWDIPRAVRSLAEVGVDPIGLVEYAEHMFFKDGQPIQLEFYDFMELVLDLRGSNRATLKDLKVLWKQVCPKLARTGKDIQEARDEMTQDAARLEGKIGLVVQELAHIERMLEGPRTTTWIA